VDACPYDVDSTLSYFCTKNGTFVRPFVPTFDVHTGWHVIIGDNGSGKSSVLRAIALALIGKENALAARQNWQEWITNGHDTAKVDLWIGYQQRSLFDDVPLQLVIKRDQYSATITTKSRIKTRDIDESRIQPGFSAAFGPFRRFTGGDKDYERLMRSNPRLAAHLSVFGEDIALSKALTWLKELNYKLLEKRKEGQLLEPLRQFINQAGFLPHEIRLTDISSEGVIFTDADNNRVPVENLSDSYRSILSMTFEIIRQLSLSYPKDDLFSLDATTITLPGIVLIDEIDAHLHPEWQRRIGFWLTEHFPNIQFIVTTHSPLVCQAASKGSIWRLPAPGSDQPSYRISSDSEEWKRLVYGDILEAYSTDLFSENIDRSKEAQEKYERLGELSVKELDAPLSKSEQTELEQLMDELPSTPYQQTVGIIHD